MRRKNILIILSCVLFIAFIGTFSQNQGEEGIMEEITEPTELNELEDNAFLLDNLSPGIIMTIEIIENEVQLLDSVIKLVPKTEPREEFMDSFLVRGVKGDDIVIQTWFPDLSKVVVEKVGIKPQPIRIITFALPLERPINNVVIKLKLDLPETSFDVTELVTSFCEQYPNQPFCR